LDKDDGIRQRYAVGISLVEKGGMLRLVFDDLELTRASPAEWRERCFFTFLDVDREKALRYELGQEAYASIGDAVLARLLAIYSLVEEPTE
jgi:hypothetical protein